MAKISCISKQWYRRDKGDQKVFQMGKRKENRKDRHSSLGYRETSYKVIRKKGEWSSEVGNESLKSKAYLQKGYNE